MKDQKVSTVLGATILIITATTVVIFVFLCVKKYPITYDIAPVVVPKQLQQNDELVKTKFELAILNFWQVKQVFRNSQDSNKFYYVTNFDDNSDIWVYDLASDKTYQQNGIFSIPEGNTLLLSQKLAKYKEFRGVGIIDNKFVFTEIGSDNSPGRCFSPWFYRNLSYIDLGVADPIRKSFALTQDLKMSEEQKVVECQNAF